MRVIADKRNETDGRDMEFLWRQDMDGMRQCSNDTHFIGWIWWFRNGRWIGEHQLSHLYMSHDVASDNNKYDKELLAFGWSIGSISVWYSDFRHSLIITKEWSIAHNKQTKLCLFVFRKKKTPKTISITHCFTTLVPLMNRWRACEQSAENVSVCTNDYFIFKKRQIKLSARFECMNRWVFDVIAQEAIQQCNNQTAVLLYLLHCCMQVMNYTATWRQPATNAMSNVMLSYGMRHKKIVAFRTTNTKCAPHIHFQAHGIEIVCNCWSSRTQTRIISISHFFERSVFYFFDTAGGSF